VIGARVYPNAPNVSENLLTAVPNPRLRQAHTDDEPTAAPGPFFVRDPFERHLTIEKGTPDDGPTLRTAEPHTTWEDMSTGTNHA
jgi:hypothetical protein